jgi:hypothetical protein
MSKNFTAFCLFVSLFLLGAHVQTTFAKPVHYGLIDQSNQQHRPVGRLEHSSGESLTIRPFPGTHVKIDLWRRNLSKLTKRSTVSESKK